MKLGTKINLVIVFVTTIVLTATFSVVVNTEAESTKSQVLRDAKTASDIFHSEVERMFMQLYEQKDRLQSSVDDLSNIEGVSYINITNVDGVHIATTDHNLVGTSVNARDFGFIQQVKDGVAVSDVRIDEGDHYEIERRIPVYALLSKDPTQVISVIEVEMTTRSKSAADINQVERLLQAISASLNQNARLIVLSQEEDIQAIQTITDNLSALGRVHDTDKFGFYRDFIITDEKLNIIASTNHQTDVFKNDTEEHNKYRQDVVSGVLPEVSYEGVIGGDPVLVTIKPLQITSSSGTKIVGIIENHTLISSYADRITTLELRMLVIGIIFTIVLVMVLMAVLERQVIGPLRRFSDVAHKIAGGDLEQKVEYVSDDEIGQFGKVFNSMVMNFRELDRLKSDFISVAAHQLRTPLSGVKWVIKLLLDGDLGEVNQDQKEMLLRGYETNEKMIKLVNDLLNVSRIENNKFEYKFEKNNFMALLGSLMDNSVLPSKERNIDVRLENHAGEVKEFLFDSEKLLIALQNIVDNAMKYTLPGGVVTVTVEQKGNFLEIKISDTGVGIPKEEVKKLFSKFFRATNVIHLETDGSGLGLFIVKNIIERHKGEITVESEEGKGTTFIVLLPLITDHTFYDDETNSVGLSSRNAA